MRKVKNIGEKWSVRYGCFIRVFAVCVEFTFVEGFSLMLQLGPFYCHLSNRWYDREASND